MTTNMIRGRRAGLIASAALALLAGAALLAANGQAQAQTRPAKACPKDFMASCMAACTKGGGQARLCPAYCERRKRETGCS